MIAITHIYNSGHGVQKNLKKELKYRARLARKEDPVVYMQWKEERKMAAPHTQQRLVYQDERGQSRG